MQIIISREHLLDIYLFYFRALVALTERGEQTTKPWLCIKHVNCECFPLAFGKGYVMSRCDKQEQGIVTRAPCISLNSAAWSLGLLISSRWDCLLAAASTQLLLSQETAWARCEEIEVITPVSKAEWKKCERFYCKLTFFGSAISSNEGLQRV